jgi:hypothetical protein
MLHYPSAEAAPRRGGAQNLLRCPGCGADPAAGLSSPASRRARGSTRLLTGTLPVVRRMRRRELDSRDARREFGPDQQNRAGRVVDDKPAGRSQAPGSQASTVAVAGQDEQSGAFGRGDDLPLDAPGARQPGARPAQPSGRRV